MHTHCSASALWPAPHPLATSPAAPWFTEQCLCWHLLNSHGLLQIPLHLSVSVCICVCMCAEGEQRDIFASLGDVEKKKLFNRGAHGGKVISNNVLFLQQQLCLTLNCPLFVIPPPPPSPLSMPSHTQSIAMKVWFMTAWCIGRLTHTAAPVWGTRK